MIQVNLFRASLLPGLVRSFLLAVRTCCYKNAEILTKHGSGHKSGTTDSFYPPATEMSFSQLQDIMKSR